MADKPEPMGPDLATENAVLRSRVAALESDIRSRDASAEIAKIRARRPKHVLDKNAGSAFKRPWDGR
jgi:UDP-N-acetylenolpyruvoylglucosamine reductase